MLNAILIKKQKSLGFTLLELLVTIAVIGILSSVSFSMIKEYRKKAYNVVARSAYHAAYLIGVDIFQSFENVKGLDHDLQSEKIFLRKSGELFP